MISGDLSSSITVNKADLLAYLRANLGKHLAAYTEAVKAFRQKALDAFRERVELIEAGEPFELSTGLTEPRSYAEEYEVVIGMLEMSVKSEIVLTAHEYRRFVRDDWDWQDDFARNTLAYNDPRAFARGQARRR